MRPAAASALWLPLAGLLVFGVCFSATLGFLDVSIPDVVAILWARLTGQPLPAGIDPVAATVVADVRLPRILAAVLVGGMLGVSGAVFQAILLNPLADSYTLGISTGAAFGASLVIVLQIFGLMLPVGVSVPVFAFAGGVATLAVVLFLASGDRSLSSTSLILAGVIVSAILSAAIGFLKFLADEQVGIIIFWLMGSLAGATWPNIGLLAPTALFGTLVMLFYGLRGFGYPMLAYGFLTWVMMVTPPERQSSASGWFWFSFSLGMQMPVSSNSR